MKILLLWTVVAWVRAAIAEPTCYEHCVYTSSGNHDIVLQTGCDCMRQEPVLSHQFDNSAIYYEPADYLPMPAYIYEQPFYILNPVLERRQKNSITNRATAIDNVRPSSTTRRHNADIEINIDNGPSHYRTEKHIKTNREQTSAPLYLDFNVDQGIGRSTSTKMLTVEDLKITEQSTVECADILTQLKSKKGSAMNQRINKSDQNKDLSIANFQTVIDNKCLHISNIVANSLNEIKSNRPKKNSRTVRIDNKLEHSQVKSAVEDNIHSLIHLNKTEDSGDKERTFINYTEDASYQNPVRSQEISTAAVPTITESKRTLSEIGFKNLKIENPNPKEQEFRATDVKGHSEYRPQREGSISLVKVVTHEFVNGTVQSYINGTEDISDENGDEMKSSEFNVKVEDVNKAFRSMQHSTPTPDTRRYDDMSSPLTGNLYFLYDGQKIPARFVQNHNGTLNLGIDGVTLCERLAQKVKHESGLLTTLCNCYKSGNCIHRK